MNAKHTTLTLVAALAVLAGAMPQVARAAGDSAKEPTYACTIKVAPHTPNAQLPSLAKVSDAQARTAAQAAVPGTIVKSSLEDENSCLVYSVVTRGANGKDLDVKVDAGSGLVVHQEAVSNKENDKETADGQSENEQGGEK